MYDFRSIIPQFHTTLKYCHRRVGVDPYSIVLAFKARKLADKLFLLFISKANFTGIWIPAFEGITLGEICSLRLKKTVLFISISLQILQPTLVLANPAFDQLPTGGQVVAGQASISHNGTDMNISQTSNRAAINWQSFDIGSNATVNFQQPSSSSVALNRVLDGNPSQIFGHLNANGQVFVTNNAGVYFSPTSSVNVGGLVATTNNISDTDFINNVNNFTRDGATGSVINDGSINANIGGYIALLAPEVRNNGVIIAQMGTVALAAGEAYTLQFNGQGGLSDITVTKSTIASLVENSQAIRAPGGLIILSAQAANHLQGGVVKNSGTIEAGGMVNDGGVVRLVASDSIELGGNINVDAKTDSNGKGGNVTAIASLDNSDSTIEVSGQISAHGGTTGGDGGFVETSASNVQFGEGVFIDTTAPAGKTGNWLIDPYDYTIDATAASNIATALNTSNVEVTTSANTASYGSTGSGTGNITVSSAINSASTNGLTLTAANAITVSATITTGSLILTGPGGITLNNNLTTTTDMTLNGNVTLGADITLTSGISNTYTSDTTYTVAAGVTSLTATLVGGVGGRGGNDGGHQGGDVDTGIGYVGSLTATFAVTPGQIIYIAPGSGGAHGNDSTQNNSASGGTNQFNLGNGGSSGGAGPTGSSGSGGGGGAATLITLSNTPTSSSAMLVAGGGGGAGGSGNNDACPSQCGDQNGGRYQASSMTGQTGYNSGNQGSPIDDGGGSGGGGGGLLGGLSNPSVFYVNEWTGRGANVGSSGAANGFTTTSIGTSVITSANSTNGYATLSYGGGAITINGTVNGGHALTISSPNSTISISGVVGGDAPLTSLSISGSQGISLGGGAVTTTGTQTYNGPVTLNANSNIFTTTNNTVTFAGDILKGSGVSSNLTVSTGSGAVNFNGSTGTNSTSVGAISITTTGTTSIAGSVYATSLTKSGTGITTVSGGLIQTSGSQSYADIFDLGGNATLNSTGTGDITLSKAISNSNQSNLTISANSGNVSIVGNLARGTNSIPTPIGDISVTASGTFTLGTSGTPILGEAKSLSVTAGTATIYASTSSFTTIGNLSGTGVNLTNSASFNVTNASTFTGPLSGATTLTKSGSAKLTLLGVNTYTGSTTVNAGILEIGGSGKIGNGSYNGNIAVNGTASQVRFNTSSNNTLGGTMSGTGFINTVGAGTTDITTLSHHNYYNLTTVYIVPVSSADGSSSLYGDATTTFTAYRLQTAAGGGTVITDASPTGTAVISGAPTSTSSVGSYTISYVSGITLGNERYPTPTIGNDLSWTISPRPLTVTASKVYDGSAIFSSGFSLSGMVNSDATPTLSGSASVSSINAGSYTSFASSTLSQNNSNYTLIGATIAATISRKPLNITVRKIYDGSTSFSSGFTATGMVTDDTAPTVSGTATTSGTTAGSYASFASNSLVFSNDNYTPIGGTFSVTIAARLLNIIVSKIYDGSTLFNRGFSLSGMVNGETAPLASGFANVADSTAATYNIFSNNTLSLNNPNYTLIGGTVSATITPQAPAISTIIPTTTTTTPKAEQNSAALKLPDNNTTTSSPVPKTISSTSTPSEGNGIVVSLVKEPSTEASGVISVAVPKKMVEKVDGFTFALPEKIYIPQDTATLTIKLENGNPLPSWIIFNPENKTFSATNIPSGGLPLSVLISAGGQNSTIVISEHQ